MKAAVILISGITLVLSLTLIYVAFGDENFVLSIIFVLLGLGAIGAAIKYTVGSNAYGYNGLGDLFVFVFFGWVSVLGSNFLFTQTIDSKLMLASTSIGLLSVAVLNLNNMRDIENDKKAGKMTLVVKMGLKKAKNYHQILLSLASLCFLLFLYLTKASLIPIIIINLPLIIHIRKVLGAEKYEDFDPELKKVALSTFALSLLYALFVLL